MQARAQRVRVCLGGIARRIPARCQKCCEGTQQRVTAGARASRRGELLMGAGVPGVGADPAPARPVGHLLARLLTRRRGRDAGSSGVVSQSKWIFAGRHRSYRFTRIAVDFRFAIQLAGHAW